MDLKIQNILKTVEFIFTGDLKIFQNSRYRTSLDTFLPYDECLEFSIKAKIRALKFLSVLSRCLGKQIVLHVSWFFNAVYFLTLNFENSIELLVQLSQTLKCLLKNVGSEFCDIAQYFLIESLF